MISALGPDHLLPQRPTQWGALLKHFSQLDEEFDAGEDLVDDDKKNKLRAELNIPEIQELRLEKKQGGQRKLTLREQLLMRSIMKPSAERTEEDIDAIVKAVSSRVLLHAPTVHAARGPREPPCTRRHARP